MNLLFVADLHYTLKQFDWLVANAGRFDSIVIGGDLLDLASSLDTDVQIVVVEKYLARIRAQTRLLVSSGNHDGDSRSAADESVARWLHEVKTEGLFVDGDTLALQQGRITICPWWDGPASRAELEATLAKEAQQAGRPWIWIHHAPPAGSPVSWSGKKFCGDDALLDWIHRFKPDIVLSGHIHNSPFYPGGGWVDRIGKTWVFNPGRQIGPTPAHIALDLNALTAEWMSLEGQASQRLTLDHG